MSSLGTTRLSLLTILQLSSFVVVLSSPPLVKSKDTFENSDVFDQVQPKKFAQNSDANRSRCCFGV